MPVVDDFDAKTEAFKQWLEKIGVIISPKVSIHDYRSKNQGRGLRAEQDIEEDEVLFSIPRSSVIAVDNNDQFTQFIADNADINDSEGPDPWLSLIAYMISIQSSEEWKPYFDVLPSSFNTPMFWTGDEIRNLEGSALIDKIGKQEAEEDYNSRLIPLINKDNEENTNSDSGGTKFFNNVDTSLEAFHRMGSLIMSYGFDIEPKLKNEQNNENEIEDEESVKAMVPLADILNAHTRLCNAHLCHVNSNNVLEMRSIKKISQGEQIYNTYGELPNSDLMRRYGYAQVGGTEFDVVEISTDLLVDAVKSQLIKNSNINPEEVDSQLARLRKIDEDQEIFDDAYDIPLSGELEPETVILIIFLQVTGESKNMKPRALLEAISNIALSGELTVETQPILREAITQRLTQYPAHLVAELQDDLDPTASDEIVVNRARMCEEVLAGEIRILLRCLDWISECSTVSNEKLLSGVTKKRQLSSSVDDEGLKRHRT